MKRKLSPTSFLDVTLRQRVARMVLTFRIRESVWQGFQDYVRRAQEGNLGNQDSWRYASVLHSLAIGIPEKGERGWDKPINRLEGGLSMKGGIKRIRPLSKRESLVTDTEEMAERFWEKIQERAAFYGITAGELCLSCISYHAALRPK